MFYKIKTFHLPKYLFSLIPCDQNTHNAQNIDFVETYYCRPYTFEYSFFPYIIPELYALDSDLQNVKSYLIFRKSFLKPNLIYKIHDPLGLKLPTRLTLGLSYLNEHRFNRNFESIHFVLARLKLNRLNIFSCITTTSILSK